ncbi:hypothetical protein VZT92_010620 [Zoarces viviparus]|uniref:Uncharacterized protein n=1 Tax=Zoarces viviparus TaxID=48416 RepID=A0AAW1F8T8_ZOAVI
MWFCVARREKVVPGSFQVPAPSQLSVWGSSPLLLHHCPHREKEEGPHFVQRAGEGGRLPPRRSPRAASSAAGELRSVSKQIKTLFKKNERIWQAEESWNRCWRERTL